MQDPASPPTADVRDPRHLQWKVSDVERWISRMGRQSPVGPFAPHCRFRRSQARTVRPARPRRRTAESGLDLLAGRVLRRRRCDTGGSCSRRNRCRSRTRDDDVRTAGYDSRQHGPISLASRGRPRAPVGAGKSRGEGCANSATAWTVIPARRGAAFPGTARTLHAADRRR